MTPALTARIDTAQNAFATLTVRIEFIVENIRDGFHFVGCDPDDRRFPHAYTTSSSLHGFSCALFPCIDDIHERCGWDMEITVPRTLGDICRAARGGNGVDDVHMIDTDLDEFSYLELVVVASGDLTNEVEVGSLLKDRQI